MPADRSQSEEQSLPPKPEGSHQHVETTTTKVTQHTSHNSSRQHQEQQQQSTTVVAGAAPTTNATATNITTTTTTSRYNSSTNSPKITHREALEGCILGADGIYEKTTYVTTPKIVEEIVDLELPREVTYVQKRVPVPIDEVIYKNIPTKVIPCNVNDHRTVKEKIVFKPKKEIIERKKDVIREVFTEEILEVEHVVEVPGEIIEIPKTVYIESHVVVPKYIDEVVPTMIAQRMEPVISEATMQDNCFIDVQCRVISFKPKNIDVFLPLPVERTLIARSFREEHREVASNLVPAEQYNALVKSLNADCPLEHILPLFQVSREVAEKIASRDYAAIRGSGFIPCSSGPGAAYVKVPPGTRIFPPVAATESLGPKVFQGEWPTGKYANQLNHQDSLISTPDEDPKGEHRYTPYNYSFHASQYFDPKKAQPFHVHHHIGKAKNKTQGVSSGKKRRSK